MYIVLERLIVVVKSPFNSPVDRTVSTLPVVTHPAENHAPSDSSEIIFYYMAVVRKRLISIITLTVAVFFLANILVAKLEPVYRASATLLIDFNTQFSGSNDVMGVTSSFSREALNTQLEILNSRSLFLQTAKSLNFKAQSQPAPHEKEPWFQWRSFMPEVVLDLIALLPKPTVSYSIQQDPKFNDLITSNALVARIRGGINISLVRGTHLVKIQYQSTDPALAAKVPNALSENFILNSKVSRSEMSEKTTDWLTERLMELRKQLQESEAKVQQFREESKLEESQGFQGIDSQQLETISSKLISLRGELIEKENLRRMVDSAQKRSFAAILAIPEIKNDPTVRDLVAQAAEMSQKMSVLKGRYGPKHPNMIQAVTQSGSIQNSLRRQVNNVIQSIRNEYKATRANKDSMEDQYNTIKQKLKGVGRTTAVFNDLIRDRDANRNLYDVFLAKYKETSVAGEQSIADVQAVNARIIDPAVMSLSPFKPNKKRIIMGVVIATFIFGCILAVLVEQLDNTLKHSDDVVKLLQFPILAALPVVDDKLWKTESKKLGVFFMEQYNLRFAEAVRSMRTSINLSEVNSRHDIIVVTSTVPKEGKSTVALNLAIAMSSLEKVLLIDADLRRPSIASLMGIKKNSPGLAELLNNMS
ncbi:MAG: P-loop NTPase, partial [Magnetococcales bacterium]|nr:P-loop NTPase [Magnetococcales bacterium]